MKCPHCHREGMTTSECLKRTIEQQMIEGYKAMAEENLEIAREATGRKEMKEMDGEELRRRLNEFYSSSKFTGFETIRNEILAEFDRLTEAYDNEVLISSQRAYEIKSLEKLNEAQRSTLGAVTDDWEKAAEALERICEPTVEAINKGKLSENPPVDWSYVRFETQDRIDNYLDSQQKPCEHERGFVLMRKGESKGIECCTCGKVWDYATGLRELKVQTLEEKSKAEEVLRGILERPEHYGALKGTVDAYTVDLIRDILTHFQLKEGE